MGLRSIRMPDVGEGVAEAEIVEWHVKVGDPVREDQVVAAVMTDKATVEIPTPVAGTVVALGGGVGEVLAVGAELIRIDAPGLPDSPSPKGIGKTPAAADLRDAGFPDPPGAATAGLPPPSNDPSNWRSPRRPRRGSPKPLRPRARETHALRKRPERRPRNRAPRSNRPRVATGASTTPNRVPAVARRAAADRREAARLARRPAASARGRRRFALCARHGPGGAHHP